MLPLRAGVAMQHTSIGPRSIAAVGHFFVYRTSARNLSIASVSPMRPVPSNGSHQAGTLPAGQQACFGAQPTRSRTVTAPALAASATAASSVVPDPWHTLAVLSTCAAVSQLLESHTKWGAMLSAPLLALTAALAAAAMGLLPAVSPVYDAVWRYLMPLAVALYLLDQDITSLASSGGQVLLSFLLGAGTMLAGAWCAWKLLGAAALGPHGAQLVCCLLASYIGGSVNFAAVAAATELPKALMPAAVSYICDWDASGSALLLQICCVAHYYIEPGFHALQRRVLGRLRCSSGCFARHCCNSAAVPLPYKRGVNFHHLMPVQPVVMGNVYNHLQITQFVSLTAATAATEAV